LIVKVAGAIVIVKLTLAVFAGAVESLTLNVSAVAFAAAVGVPLIVPVEEFSVTPAGKAPALIDQVYGAVPPFAVRFAV
jgi:hypothetical protein